MFSVFNVFNKSGRAMITY